MIQELKYYVKYLITKLRVIKRSTLTYAGIKPSPKDERDYLAKSLYDDSYLPKRVIIHEGIGIIKDQSFTNACAGFALSGAYETAWKQNIGERINMSALYPYYKARQVRGREAYDEGCFIRDALQSALTDGIALEQYHSFHPFRVFSKPSLQADISARYNRVISYWRCTTLKDIKRAIKNQHEVIIGMLVNNEFMRHRTSDSYEVFKERINQGSGHAMRIIGYDDEKKAFLIINSWGRAWGNNGLGWISYDTVNSAWFEAWFILSRSATPRPTF